MDSNLLHLKNWREHLLDSELDSRIAVAGDLLRPNSANSIARITPLTNCGKRLVYFSKPELSEALIFWWRRR
jgi:hypothetical protein